MGYTLRIGENIDGNVKTVRHDDAPAFGEPTDYTNARRPSYTAWWGFARAAGLESLFESLLNPRPGIQPLTTEHLGAFKKVKIRQLDQWDRNRLVWLIYWTEWALNNCKNPAIYNS